MHDIWSTDQQFLYPNRKSCTNTRNQIESSSRDPSNHKIGSIRLYILWHLSLNGRNNNNKLLHCPNPTYFRTQPILSHLGKTKPKIPPFQFPIQSKMETKSTSPSPPIRSDHQPSRKTTKILTLPEEIIGEILHRLPVKSLLKFRCVSKSWRTLISSPHFCDAHLKIPTKDSNFSRQRVISTVLLPFYTLKQCSLQSLLCGPEAHAIDLDYPMKNPKNSARVVGSCNGIVCIAVNGKHFFLWNPSTRRYKNLGEVDDRMKRGLFITKYGFGFDETNNDYKVVGILSGFCSGGRYESVVKIYSLRHDSWKVIDVFKDGLPFDDNGKFVNGRLHWGRRFGVDSKWEIVSFDLGSEVCGKVDQPSYLDFDFSPSLGVVESCLCVVCDFPKISVDVWILKKYGVRDSWMKLVVVPYLDDPWKGPYLTPLSIGAKGEILLAYGSSFVVYDPKDNSFRRPKIRNFDTFLEADVYIESLVSLDPHS